MKETIGKVFKSVCLFLITLSMISIAMSLISVSRINSNVYDVNKDGKVSPADYILIKNYIMNHE